MVFHRVRVKELGLVVTGKTPSTKDSLNYGDDYMFIGPTDLHQNFLISSSVKTISEKGFTSIKNNTLAGLSVLVGCIGWDLGNVGIVNAQCATNQQINSITKFKPEINPYYIYYWFKTKKEFLFQIANVTRTPILNKTDFSEIEINLPDRFNQNQIAKVLSDLDSKIELNNKINAELEAMAKLLYDYWFVQFDFPNQEGKPYKSSGGKMVYNKQLKREIPEDWEVKELIDIADIKAGGDKPKVISEHKTETYNIPIYSNGVTDEGLYGYTDTPKITKSSITVSARGTIGYSVLRFTPFVPIIRLIAVTPKNAFELKFLHERIKMLEFDDSGSVQKQLTVPQISKLKLVYPDSKLLKKYHSITESGIRKIESNKKENQKLAELRDWLLPMLMNGQVSVKQAQEDIKMAAEPSVGYKTR